MSCAFFIVIIIFSFVKNEINISHDRFVKLNRTNKIEFLSLSLQYFSFTELLLKRMPARVKVRFGRMQRTSPKTLYRKMNDSSVKNIY